MSPIAQANYHQITECTESYFDRFGDSPLGMGWPNVTDAVSRYDVMLDIVRPSSSLPVRLLDFGCGAGHLFEHITAQGRTDIEYHGIDLSQRFIDSCRRKHPTIDFRCGDILEHPENLPDFDYACPGSTSA
jgi:2-polyprenyl-3-methyl-5-hydroxy-6-metoxy-1,4-benzoquinol methylase